MTFFRQTRRAAFTLIEIMVAITILALVLVAIYSTWTAILKATRVGLEAAAQAQRERIAMRTMTEALESARLFAANRSWYYFVASGGEDPTLTFVSHLPRWFPRGGKFGEHDVRRVTFSLESGPDSTRQLVLRQAPLLIEIDQDEQEHPLVLVQNVKKLEFAFWDKKVKDWVDVWDDNDHTNQLPTLVRITLSVGGRPGSFTASWQPRGPEDEITRVVSVASLGVPVQWQAPAAPPAPPGPGGTNPPVGRGPVPVPPVTLQPGIGRPQ